MVVLKNTYEVYSDTSIAYDVIFKELSLAKKSIHLESFKIADDKIGSKLLDILYEKSKSIKVHLIADYWGTGKRSIKRIESMDTLGIRKTIFNPLIISIKSIQIRKFLEHLHIRNHRKLIIIDDELAFVGGMNFSSNELKWVDILVKIKGPIVKQLITASKEMVNIAFNTHLIPRRKIIHSLTKHFVKSDLVVRQIPFSRHQPLKKEFIRLLNSAKKEILFTTPYFIPDIFIITALKKAIKRGVKVKILIPEKCDNYLADLLNKSYAFLKFSQGVNLFLCKKMTHAKYVIVDDKFCSFGSANMDFQTWIYNYELNIISSNKKLISQLKKTFDETLKISIPFTEDYWWNRSLWKKFLTPITNYYKKNF